MSMRISVLPTLLIAAAALMAGPLFAQSEFALGVGELSGSSPSAAGGALSLNSNVAVEGNYARKFRETGWANLYWEVDGIYGPIRYLTGTPATVPNDIHSVFVMPGLKLQFAAKEPISPWIAVGGGYAYYGASKASIAGGASGVGSTSTGGADFGVGFDFSTGRKYALRADLRGNYTGNPKLGIPASGGQFNLAIGLGLVWRGTK